MDYQWMEEIMRRQETKGRSYPPLLQLSELLLAHMGSFEANPAGEVEVPEAACGMKQKDVSRRVKENAPRIVDFP